ncbi:Peptidase M20 [Gracilaria domingensis]|nr:Peptidase M20 [Gracilaria domingensis]
MTQSTEQTDSVKSVDLFNDVRKLIASNADVYVSRLAEAVAIPSVSTELSKRNACFQMADLLDKWIEDLGGKSDKVLVGFQELDDGQRFDLPPVILAEFEAGNKQKSKPTVLVYGHYDVQPADKADGWSSEPFTLTEKNEMLYGRGSTDDKGPILAWLWAIEIYRELELELPVNIKMCLEGMEESNSECLEDLLNREAKNGGFLKDVDYVVITDNYWLTTSKPCLTYGLRGLATFECEVRAGSQTLHSGVYGGCIAEPMTDLIQLLSTVSRGVHGLVDIPGCRKEDCAPLEETEEDLYSNITFDSEDFMKEAGNVPSLVGDTPSEVLMNRWRYPSLSIHGIEGAYSGQGMKTVIPGAVTAKFSIRLVPGQDGKLVEEEVTKLLQERLRELNTPNELRVTSSSSEPWLANPKCPLYQAGAAALLKVYGVRPDYTREGGSIPITSMVEKILGAETMLLPLGSSDDGAHSENEKIGRKNYIHGVHVLFVLLEEINRIHSSREDKTTAGQTKKGTLGRLKDIWFGLS